MKYVYKFIFSQPEPILDVKDDMEFSFPYICLIKTYNVYSSHVLDCELQNHKYLVKVPLQLLELWGYKKWQFEPPTYYANLYKIIFYLIKPHIIENAEISYVFDSYLHTLQYQEYKEKVLPPTRSLEKPTGNTFEVIRFAPISETQISPD